MKELMDSSESPARIIAEITNKALKDFAACPLKFAHTMNRLHFTHYLTMHQFIKDNKIDELKEYYIEREPIKGGEWNLYWRN